jgi:hypothetical protein
MCSEHEKIHPKDNLYMWGHYGNGHRGVAIEFNTQGLAKDVLEENARVSGSHVTIDNIWGKIEYLDRLSPLTCEMFYEFFKEEHERENKNKLPQKTKLEDYYELMAKIKGLEWEREHEWRLTWHNNKTADKIYKCLISSAGIDTIYLGQNIDADAQRHITQEAHDNFPNAKIYKAKKRAGYLGLEFDLLSS